ncbi:MAG TPA: heavy metal-associated domain-containing protein [Candidatus Eisenbacteria bacterium]
MKTLAKIGALSLLAVCIAATSWAGGKSCSSEGAKSASAGSHCSAKGSNTNAMALKECSIKANQAIYSFAVPTAHCESCIEGVQKAAMAQAGVACAHVDLSTHTAYIIADKKVNQKEIAKAIAAAGYKNSYKGEGSKVQAQFAKAIAAGDKGVACCAKGKDKV